jgi:hypothetical protein
MHNLSGEETRKLLAAYGRDLRVLRDALSD